MTTVGLVEDDKDRPPGYKGPASGGAVAAPVPVRVPVPVPTPAPIKAAVAVPAKAPVPAKPVAPVASSAPAAPVAAATSTASTASNAFRRPGGGGGGPPPAKTAGKAKWLPKGAVPLFGGVDKNELKKHIDVFQHKSPFRRDARQIIQPAAFKPFKKTGNEEKQAAVIQEAEKERTSHMAQRRSGREGPKEQKEFPMEERKALLTALQQYKPFASAQGGQMNVTVSDLDKVLSEATSLAEAVLMLQFLHSQGRMVEGFAGLVAITTPTLVKMDGEVMRLRAMLDGWTEAAVKELYKEGGAGVNTVMCVKQHHHPPYRPSSSATILASLKAAVTNIQGRGKSELIAFLSSPGMSLFSGTIQLMTSDVSKLISNSGGYAALVVSDLRVLDGLGRKYGTFGELGPAIASDADLKTFKAKILTELFCLRLKLFRRILQVPMTSETVDSILAEGGGGIETPEILHLLANHPDAPYSTLQDVCEHARSFSDERNKNISDQIEKSFAYLGTVGDKLFSREIEVTNASIKKLVLTVFNAHYPLTGGDCVPVLKRIVAQSLKFKTLEELELEVVKQAEEDDDIMPPPPDLPPGECFDWEPSFNFGPPVPEDEGPDIEIDLSNHPNNHLMSGKTVRALTVDDDDEPPPPPPPC